MAVQSVIHSDPEIMSGTPVFIGTRVPVKNLIDYIAGGDPLDEFLDDFPSVTREQAVAAIEETKQLWPATPGVQSDPPNSPPKRRCAKFRAHSADLPADAASQVDHFLYGTPKR